jgi:hypothetical protein
VERILSKLTQPQQPIDAEKPAAEIVAERYGFPLAFHDTDEGRFYAVQDWIAGVAKVPEPRKYWHDIKRRTKRSKVELSVLCRQLPYKVANGRTYRVDHVNAQTLYYITQRMDANTGVRDAVIDYLAKAGVLVDEIRKDPQAAADALTNIAARREYRKMIEEGFTHEEAIQWLDIRDKQKHDRKVIVGIWKERGARPIDFAILTNQAHAIAVGVTATEHKRQLAVQDSVRNYVSAADNAAIQITEYTAGLLHNSRNSYGVSELSEDIEQIRPIIDAARPEINRVFSQKPRRLPNATPQHYAVLRAPSEVTTLPEVTEQAMLVEIRFQRSEDPQRDIRKLRMLVDVLTSYPGKDRFQLIVGDNILEFPHTTLVCEEMISTLHRLIEPQDITITDLQARDEDQ